MVKESLQGINQDAQSGSKTLEEPKHDYIIVEVATSELTFDFTRPRFYGVE